MSVAPARQRAAWLVSRARSAGFFRCFPAGYIGFMARARGDRQTTAGRIATGRTVRCARRATRSCDAPSDRRASTARGPRAKRTRTPYRLWRRRAAGARREITGIVRSRGHAAHREWPRGADLASALARRTANPDHPGSEEFLGTHLSRGKKGIEGTLSKASLAG